MRPDAATPPGLVPAGGALLNNPHPSVANTGARDNGPRASSHPAPRVTLLHPRDDDTSRAAPAGPHPAP